MSKATPRSAPVARVVSTSPSGWSEPQCRLMFCPLGSAFSMCGLIPNRASSKGATRLAEPLAQSTTSRKREKSSPAGIRLTRYSTYSSTQPGTRCAASSRAAGKFAIVLIKPSISSS